MPLTVSSVPCLLQITRNMLEPMQPTPEPRQILSRGCMRNHPDQVLFSCQPGHSRHRLPAQASPKEPRNYLRLLRALVPMPPSPKKTHQDQARVDTKALDLSKLACIKTIMALSSKSNRLNPSIVSKQGGHPPAPPS